MSIRTCGFYPTRDEFRDSEYINVGILKWMFDQTKDEDESLQVERSSDND